MNAQEYIEEFGVHTVNGEDLESRSGRTIQINTDYAENRACPKCGNRGEDAWFRLHGTCTIKVDDNETLTEEDTYDDSTTCECGSCNYTSEWRAFHIPNLDSALQELLDNYEDPDNEDDEDDEEESKPAEESTAPQPTEEQKPTTTGWDTTGL